MSFGYEMMVSLIQLARAFCIIANGGYAVQPTLLKDDEKLSVHNEKLYKDHTLSVMKSILAKIGEKYTIPGYSVFWLKRERHVRLLTAVILVRRTVTHLPAL